MIYELILVRFYFLCVRLRRGVAFRRNTQYNTQYPHWLWSKQNSRMRGKIIFVLDTRHDWRSPTHGYWTTLQTTLVKRGALSWRCTQWRCPCFQRIMSTHFLLFFYINFASEMHDMFAHGVRLVIVRRHNNIGILVQWHNIPPWYWDTNGPN